jgi:hypothetical protein
MHTCIRHELARVLVVAVEGQRCNTVDCCDVLQIRGREEGGEILKGQREGRQWIGDVISKEPPPLPSPLKCNRSFALIFVYLTEYQNTRDTEYLCLCFV